MKYLILVMLISCAHKTAEKPLPPAKVSVLPAIEKLNDFSVKSALAWIAEDAKIANCVINNKEFIAEVAKVEKFDFTKDTGAMVAEKMSKSHPVVVSTYCKKPFMGRQTNAYRNVGSNVVYLNLCVKRNSIEKRINTLCHEFFHVMGYGHLNNDYRGKEKSVNYFLGKMAEKYVQGCVK